LSCPGKKKSESKPETIEEGSYDILTVQELLGHSDVKATIIYTHVLN
jgi:site-specific recombinase XerD